MKKIFKFFCFLFYSTICFSQKNISYDWYLNETNNGLCNESLVIFSDSTYCSEKGCESSSYFSFGKWKPSATGICFSPVDLTTYNFIEAIEKKNINQDNITVIILDKYGNNICDMITVGQFIEHVGMYNFTLDSTKTKLFDFKRTGNTIILKNLSYIFKRNFEIKIDSFNLFIIHLNISKDWNFHINSKWRDQNTFFLKKENGNLRFEFPGHTNDKDPVWNKVYVKQK